MKKLLNTFIFVTIILTACGPGQIPDNSIDAGNLLVENQPDEINNQPAETNSENNLGDSNAATPESEPTDNPVAALPVVEVPSLDDPLPTIPEVSYSTSSEWFKPTDPDDINLANGQVQFMKFSAVW